MAPLALLLRKRLVRRLLVVLPDGSRQYRYSNPNTSPCTQKSDLVSTGAGRSAIKALADARPESGTCDGSTTGSTWSPGRTG